VNHLLAREFLEPIDRGIDVNRVKFYDVGATSGLLGCDDGRADAAEAVEDDAAALRTIHYRIGDHGDRLDRRVHRQLVAPSFA
jgi:hypothetical protein